MAINERLLSMLMQKNPDLTFALEESFPLTSTYAQALPLGPLMQLSAVNEQNPFDAERASSTLQYWQNAAQQVLADPEATASEAVLRSYSHDTAAAANLLAAHDFAAQAEAIYRLATQLYPANPEPASGLADLLTRNGQLDEARQLLDDFAQKYPDQKKALEKSRALWSATLGSTKQ